MCLLSGKSDCNGTRPLYVPSREGERKGQYRSINVGMERKVRRRPFGIRVPPL
jgi:hypothetical protein